MCSSSCDWTQPSARSIMPPSARFWPGGRPTDPGTHSTRGASARWPMTCGMTSVSTVKTMSTSGWPSAASMPQHSRRCWSAKPVVDGPAARTWPRFVPPCWRSYGCRRTTHACARRAETKRRHLAAHGLDGVQGPVGLDDDDLWTWWFSRHHRDRPTNLLVVARAHGFADVPSFRQAVIDEYHFVSRSGLTDDDIHMATDGTDHDQEPPMEEAPITVSVSALRALLRRAQSQRDLTDDDFIARTDVADV